MRSLSLSLLLGFALSACSPWGSANKRKPHILIIAVESLGFENASCLDDALAGEADDGFEELCHSALRFTHFYAPSSMSQSSLASLLTGVEASEHKVLHNGNDGIPTQLVTLAEKALQGGYRTAFFSGGPPFLAKSGFQQGYEIFDDDFHNSPEVYTTAEVLLQRALDWFVSQQQPTMSTVFLADLQFPNVRTFTDERKERERSVLGQKQEVAESLGAFFRQLKKRKLWDNSYILLVGLNGEAPMNRKSFLWRENLFRENVHVPLFIKTPQLKEARSIDYLISMKNIGQLLRDSLEQSLSVADFVMQKLDEWKDTPPSHLEIRSDWGSWWMGKPPLLSLRTAEYLVIPQKRWQVYHTLVDKSEGTVLSEQQMDREKLRWIKSRVEQSYDLQSSTPSELYDFIKNFRTVKMTGTPYLVRELYRQEKNHWTELLMMDEALRLGDWARLKDSPHALYRYVASRQLQSAAAVILSGACERFFVEKPRESLYRRCRDPLFLSLLDWEKHKNDSDALQWEKNFMRQYRSFMQAKQMAYLNIYLELNWDVNVFSMLGPSLAELYLQLPEKNMFRRKVESYQIPLAVGFPTL